MNSSAQPFRRIASNRLWTPQGVVCNPLAEIAPDGTVLSVRTCPDPDREPFTEFQAGLLVPGFPADYRAAFAQLLARRDQPLDKLLSELIPERFWERFPERFPELFPTAHVLPELAAAGRSAFPAAASLPNADSSSLLVNESLPDADSSSLRITESLPDADSLPLGIMGAPSRPTPDPLLKTASLLDNASGGCLVVLSGLDYDPLRLTPQSQIRRISPI